MTYGAHDALRDALQDLWDHQELIDLLESKDAVTAGWPNDGQGYPVVVRVQPITETSSASHEHATIERTFRLQVSVVATDEWRSNRPQPTYSMAEIMSTVGDRLDIAVDAPELLPEGTASSSWQEVSGNRLALIQDWQITTYTR